MPAYIIAMANIKDPAKYQEYAKRAGPANAKHGSRFLVRGGKKHTLEGDIPFERIVVSEFPDVETAKTVITYKDPAVPGSIFGRSRSSKSILASRPS